MKTELENDKKVKLILSIGEILKTHIKAIDVGYEVRYNDLCMELVNFVEALSINRSVPTKASLVKVPTKELKYITDEDAKELIKVAFPYVKNTKDIEIVQGGIMFRAKSPNGYSYLSKTIDLDDSMSLKTAVFLQSKGYKLPFYLSTPSELPTLELILKGKSKYKKLDETTDQAYNRGKIDCYKLLKTFLSIKDHKLPITHLNLPYQCKSTYG